MTTASKTIEQRLCNVTKPTWILDTCQCGNLRKQLPKHCVIEGHVLAIGRDFPTTTNKTLSVNSGNNPRPTWGDAFYMWDQLEKQLPPALRQTDKKVTKQYMYGCRHSTRRVYSTDTEWEIPTTKQVYQMRTQLKGMVVGTLDKNKGELWVACPVLYHKAMQKAYDTGYERIHIAKLSPYRKRKYTTTELPKQIIRTTAVPEKQQGTERDINISLICFSDYTNSMDGNSWRSSIDMVDSTSHIYSLRQKTWLTQKHGNKSGIKFDRLHRRRSTR